MATAMKTPEGMIKWIPAFAGMRGVGWYTNRYPDLLIPAQAGIQRHLTIGNVHDYEKKDSRAND